MRRALTIERWRKKNIVRSRAIRREAAKRFRERHPEKVAAIDRWRKIKAKFGLTEQDWTALFEQQGRQCACCGATKPGHRAGWQTDHCHKTGRVRGILCCLCNLAVGYYESPRRFLAAAYLEKI